MHCTIGSFFTPVQRVCTTFHEELSENRTAFHEYRPLSSNALRCTRCHSHSDLANLWTRKHFVGSTIGSSTPKHRQRYDKAYFVHGGDTMQSRKNKIGSSVARLNIRGLAESKHCHRSNSSTCLSVVISSPFIFSALPTVYRHCLAIVVVFFVTVLMP